MTALSKSNEWKSPAKVYQPLNERYAFTLDAAAAHWNAQCPRYFTRRDNALKLRWSGRVWLNPPYSRGSLAAWMGKARSETLLRRVELVCCLVPAYTGESWWHQHVESSAGRLLSVDLDLDAMGATTIVRWEHLTVSTTRLRGRLRFRERNGKTGGARFSSAVVVFSSGVKA